MVRGCEDNVVTTISKLILFEEHSFMKGQIFEYHLSSVARVDYSSMSLAANNNY